MLAPGHNWARKMTQQNVHLFYLGFFLVLNAFNLTIFDLHLWLVTLILYYRSKLHYFLYLRQWIYSSKGYAWFFRETSNNQIQLIVEMKTCWRLLRSLLFVSFFIGRPLNLKTPTIDSTYSFYTYLRNFPSPIRSDYLRHL